MNILKIKIFLILCCIVLISACSKEPTIKSSTEDMVVIGSPTDMFFEAYELAKKECEKNNRYAQYISDETKDIEEVSFNCIDPYAEAAAAEGEADTETAEETVMESDSGAIVEEDVTTDTESEPANGEEMEADTELETLMEEEAIPEAEDNMELETESQSENKLEIETDIEIEEIENAVEMEINEVEEETTTEVEDTMELETESQSENKLEIETDIEIEEIENAVEMEINEVEEEISTQ